MDSTTTPRFFATNFVALALVINRPREGPTFVFHYPSQVDSVYPRPGTESLPEDPLEHGDIILERLSGGRPREPAGSSAAANPPLWGRDDSHGGAALDGGASDAPWDHVAGFPTRDLAHLLTPGSPYHKKLFQLSLDPLYCVSYPIHAPKGGRWKKRKKLRKEKGPTLDESTTLRSLDSQLGLAEGEKSDSTSTTTTTTTTATATNTTTDSINDTSETEPSVAGDGAAGKAGDNNSSINHIKPSSMNMFNLVFILKPKRHEVSDLVEALYPNIVKTVNKALKYSQEHSDFVWKESKKILAMKEKGREERRRMSSLWKEIVATSSLAASIQEIYEAVSHNRIATLQLDTAGGALTPSVQIPMPFSIADLPRNGEGHKQGLLLTTANAFVEVDAPDGSSFLEKNFSLLFLEDEKNIMAELQADPDPGTQIAVEFVRLSKPTISFHKAGQSTAFSPSQVRRYAQHFIFWRRAIAIPTLHARDVYILSPNCNMSRLPLASVRWQRQFSHVPSLPNFLAELSYAPRPYKHFVPTKSLRPMYLQMLAWLLRGGWATQLCTFAYVIVWPEIVYEVDYYMEAEELKKAAAKSQGGADSRGPPFEAADDPTGTSVPHVPTMTEQAAEQARLERIADKANREAAEKAMAHARKAIPTRSDHPSLNNAPHLQAVEPYIILDAKKATGKESLYLTAIAQRFGDEKTAVAWQRFLRYFSGQCALERIAIQEDMKRKETWSLLTSMSEFLLCVRHW